MNVVKSAPFALLAICKLPCTPPKLSKSPNFCESRENLPTIFQFAHKKMAIPKFTANSAKSTQIAHFWYESREIRVILTNFTPFSTTVVQLYKFANYVKLSKIRTGLFIVFSLQTLAYGKLQALCATPCLREFRKFQNFNHISQKFSLFINLN